MMDDGAENAWGGLYEAGAYGHLEELGVYDQSDPICREGGMGFVAETIKSTIDNHLAFSLNAVGDPCHAMYSPHVYRYHEHLADIKEEFDPAGMSDAMFYVNREQVEMFIKAMDAGEEFDLRM